MTASLHPAHGVADCSKQLSKAFSKADAKIQLFFFNNFKKYTPCFLFFFFKYRLYKIRQLEETRGASP